MTVKRGLAAVESGYRDLLSRLATHGPAVGDPFDEGPARKRDAKAVAEALGHALVRFSPKDHGARHVAMCHRCTALVIVHLEEGTYGPAVTMRCRGEGGATT